MGLFGPPLKILEARIVPRHRGGIGKETTGGVEAQLKGAHSQPRPRNDGRQGQHDTQKLSPQRQWLLRTRHEFEKQRGELLDTLWGRENLQRTCLKSHPQVIQSLRQIQRALGEVHPDPEILAKPKEKVPCLHYILKLGPEDEPVVQVTKDVEPVTVHDDRHRGHDPCEHLWGSQQTETKGAELQDRALTQNLR